MRYGKASGIRHSRMTTEAKAAKEEHMAEL